MASIFFKTTAESYLPVKTCWLILVQSIYLMITAIWPLLSIDSFMAITGYKTDTWLVMTVAALLLAVSLCMALYLVIRTDRRPAALLGMCTAVALVSIDVYYVAHRIISKIYLLDAAIQLVILVSWIWIMVSEKKGFRPVRFVAEE
jgi:hypothetical protein